MKPALEKVVRLIASRDFFIVSTKSGIAFGLCF